MRSERQAGLCSVSGACEPATSVSVDSLARPPARQLASQSLKLSRVNDNPQNPENTRKSLGEPRKMVRPDR